MFVYPLVYVVKDGQDQRPCQVDRHPEPGRRTVDEGITAMTMGDKIKHAAQDVTGKAKEAAGKVTGNGANTAEST